MEHRSVDMSAQGFISVNINWLTQRTRLPVTCSAFKALADLLRVAEALVQA